VRRLIEMIDRRVGFVPLPRERCCDDCFSEYPFMGWFLWEEIHFLKLLEKYHAKSDSVKKSDIFFKTVVCLNSSEKGWTIPFVHRCWHYERCQAILKPDTKAVSSLKVFTVAEILFNLFLTDTNTQL
jgi:hypothetical protein